MDSVTAQCPYCGEEVEVTVDPGGPSHQRYVEDCPVCCRPWDVVVSREGDDSGDEGLCVQLLRSDE